MGNVHSFTGRVSFVFSEVWDKEENASAAFDIPLVKPSPVEERMPLARIVSPFCSPQ